MAPPSSPLVLSRPPRAPNAVSLSIHVDHVEKSGIPRGPSSCRSTHFLDGFNVDDCLDVRTIPDPPTPQPRKRRLSIPVNLRSLEDVTNNPSANKSSKRDDGEKKRKARKSLCHVPSPIVVQQNPVIPPLVPHRLEEGQPESSEADAQEMVNHHHHQPPTSAKTSICFDDDENEDNDGTVHRRISSSRNGSRRRKKRQSMIIPSELIIPPQPLDTAQAVLPKVSPPSSATMKKKFEGSLQDMKNLQALVRGYCDLPVEDRDISDQARTILESTGYPLHNNVNRPASPISDNDKPIRNLRRSILRKIAPVIQDMDKRKIHDTKMLEDATGCRVEKGTRSGKYRYYSLETSNKVPPAEYKDRYMAFIENGAGNRAAQAEAWKEKLIENQDEEEVVMEEQEEAMISTEVVDPDASRQLKTETKLREEIAMEEPVSPLSDTSESKVLQVESPQLDLQAQEESSRAEAPVEEHDKESDHQQQQEEGDEDDKMELCNMSASLDMGDIDALPVDLDGGSETEAQEKKEAKANEARVDPQNQEEETHASQENQLQVEERNSPPVVALPSRERGQSNDPEIARAEKRLWKRIDDALHDYSEEVMKILQKRKRQKTMKHEK
ncbi:unnamed protein product [Cylindrotheca closterium]|uniref:Uncharacterized protein n=1 Tax=Cylindrotheca closterium TaxID=2856 RepID=A0AAD2FDH1_9STRA|nr:unnamed protein product [Cylindrotheca closterium]